VFCVFFIYAGSAVPAINEPHYWTKAAHFWNDDFGRGDLFLESGDAHWLFFATFGYLTRCFPMVFAVWIGRFITWWLLAMGWTALGRSLFASPVADNRENSPRSVVLAPPLIASVWAILWLVGLHWGHWAGEWVVGGCESKGIAYACIFGGLALAIRQRFTWSWVLFGVAAAYHVVTGVWVIACVGCVTLWLEIASHRGQWSLRSYLHKHGLGWAICVVGLCVGAIPAMRIDWGIDPQLATESAVKQVYTRLGHHLAPSRINTFRWQSFGVQLLITGWVFLWLAQSRWVGSSDLVGDEKLGDDSGNGTPRASKLSRLKEVFCSLPYGIQFLIGCGFFALAIAGIGTLIDYGLGKLNINLAAKLLRFYWFRWNDVALPMMVGAIITAFGFGYLKHRSYPHLARVVAWLAIVVPGAFLLGYRFEANYQESIPAGDKAHFAAKSDSEIDQLKQFEDWLRVCSWIRENTDPKGLWLTPRRQQSFKWHTGRPELACWKDAPQNALAVIEWSQRLSDAFQYDSEKILQPWTTEKLWELHNKYGVRYVLMDRRVIGQNPPLLPILYPAHDDFNENFAVFEFPQLQMNASQ
jgi:hypothetical protein